MTGWADEGLLATIEQTPVMLLERSVLADNVARMAAATTTAGVALRPHAKTHKLPQVARMQVAAGAVGIQVATLHEAEVFADAGVNDILVGFPIVGTVGIRRLVALAGRCRISVSLDAMEVARPIAAAARSASVDLAMRLEIDTGLMRVGVQPDAALAMATQLAALRGITFAGVMTHEGQLYGQARDRATLAATTADIAARMVTVAERIRAAGIDCPSVSIGSSATAAAGMRAAGITEVRPGTYVFNDGTQLGQGSATLDQIATVVVATVISRPDDERAVIDAGSKVLAADRLIVPDPPATFGTLPGLPGHRLTRISEEHGVVSLPAGSQLGIGDRVVIVPNHICPAVNLADELLVVANGRVVDRWPVAARGHR